MILKIDFTAKKPSIIVENEACNIVSMPDGNTYYMHITMEEDKKERNRCQ